MSFCLNQKDFSTPCEVFQFNTRQYFSVIKIVKEINDSWYLYHLIIVDTTISILIV